MQPRPSLRRLLPTTIEVEEVFGPLGGGELLPGEAVALGWCTEKRRIEFGMGRHCARSAVSRLGVAPTPILIGGNKEPVWPPGLLGSITHCTSYCGAAVTFERMYSGVGIDVEPNADILPATLAMVANEEEIKQLETLPEGNIHWGTLLFSAKESVYKAIFPTVRAFVGYEAAFVEINVRRNCFQARLVNNVMNGAVLNGTFMASDDLLLTAVVIARS